MLILRDIAILWAACHVYVIAGFLFEPRYPVRKTIYAMLAVLLPVLVLNCLLFITLGPEKTGQVILLTGSLPSLLGFWLMSRQRDGRAFFTFFLVNTVVFAFLLVSHIIDYYLIGDQLIFFFAVQIVVYPLVEWFIWKRIRPVYQELLHSVQHGWGLFAVISMMFFLILVLMSSWPVAFYKRQGQAAVLMLVILTMALMYMTIFQVLYIQQKSFSTMETERRLEQQSRLLRNELSAEQEYVFNAKRFRHDLHHHGKIVLEYLEQDDAEKAKQYLRSYREYMKEETLQRYCENLAINALLRITARRCLAAGVEFNFEGNIPQEISMPEPELAAVFGNLFENACEACEKCRKGKLHIKAEIWHDLLRVEIRNSVSGRVVFDGDLPSSTKKSGGIGLQSSVVVLNRHDGMMVCKQEGNTFLTRVILPL